MDDSQVTPPLAPGEIIFCALLLAEECGEPAAWPAYLDDARQELMTALISGFTPRLNARNVAEYRAARAHVAKEMPAMFEPSCPLYERPFGVSVLIH